MSFCLTAGNIDDRNPKVIEYLTKNIFGKLFENKDYISQKLFENLWSKKGIQLITKQEHKKERTYGVLRQTYTKKKSDNRIGE